MRETTNHCGASGTNAPTIRASGGVSNVAESEIVFVSPIKKTEELDTPTMRIAPTCKPRLTTVKFISDSHPLLNKNKGKLIGLLVNDLKSDELSFQHLV
jgi:hypothetical protein